MTEVHKKPLTHTERKAIFGSFTFQPAPIAGNAERIIIDPKWTRENIVTVEVPQLARKVQMHKLAATKLLELFAAWEEAGLKDEILTFNGGWAPRYKRGKAGGTEKDLSNHSLGSAFDINAKWNGLGKVPAAIGQQGSVRKLVPIAEARGWAWGGWWKIPDGMHFELAEI